MSPASDNHREMTGVPTTDAAGRTARLLAEAGLPPGSDVRLTGFLHRLAGQADRPMPPASAELAALLTEGLPDLPPGFPPSRAAAGVSPADQLEPAQRRTVRLRSRGVLAAGGVAALALAAVSGAAAASDRLPGRPPAVFRFIFDDSQHHQPGDSAPAQQSSRAPNGTAGHRSTSGVTEPAVPGTAVPGTAGPSTVPRSPMTGWSSDDARESAQPSETARPTPTDAERYGTPTGSGQPPPSESGEPTEPR